MNHEQENMNKGGGAMEMHHYRNLIIMTVLSFIAMYILMYAMVNIPGNVINNVNNFYMAGLMAAPMVIIEVVIMRAMYKNGRLNAIIVAAAVAALILLFLFIRQQTAVGDRQFLRSMIPHHASAILMCQQASIQDGEIKSLCESIISSQQSEIDQMKQILERLDQ